jgi:hypothetical protein
MKRKYAAVAAALVTASSAALVAIAGPAAAATGSPSDPANLSDNPILATNLNGWVINVGGSALTRVAVTDHVAAAWAAQTVSSTTTTRVRMPAEPVTPNNGQAWTYAIDVKGTAAAPQATVTVEWYTSTGAFISYNESAPVSINGTNWTRVVESVIPPANAASAQSQLNVLGTAKKATIQATQHDVRAPVVAPPTTTTTTDPPTTTTDPPPTSTDPPPTSTTTTTPPPPGVTLTPTQPAGFFYSGVPGSAYAQPGAMTVAGRTNYADPGFQAVSTAGGHTLIYLDPVVKNSFGRYHDLLFNASTYGPAVPDWPGSPTANTGGKLADFRTGGVLQSKLEGVLELMVAENPHMAGWFIDDLGSRSWFPGFNWDTFGTANQQAYRDGAIAVAQTVRTVADRYHLMFLVNGTWQAGPLSAGGGYPDANQHGLSLAEGGVVEHHSTADAFWLAYGATGAQWGSASPATGAGHPVMLVIGSADSERQQWVNAGFAYYVTQSDYGTGPTPWGPSHATGLPTHAS